MSKEKHAQNRTFKQGFKTPTIGVYIATIIISLAVLFFMNYYYTSGMYLGTPKEKFLSNESDYTSHLVYDVGLAQNSKTDDYRIYVIGGSSTRHAFISDDFTEKALLDQYGDGYDFILLSANMLMNLDNLLIVENLPDENGCVVLCLNVRRATIYSEPGRFSLPGKLFVDHVNNNPLIEELEITNKKVTNYFGGQLVKKALNRVLLSSRFRDITRPFHLSAYDSNYTDRMTDEEIAQKVKKEAEILQGGLSEPQMVLFKQVLMDMAAVCEAKGLDLLLVDGPYNTDLFDDETLNGEGSALFAYRAILRSVADETAAEYADFVWDMGIEDPVFLDIVHLSAYEARADYTRALVESLGVFIKDAPIK